MHHWSKCLFLFIFWSYSYSLIQVLPETSFWNSKLQKMSVFLSLIALTVDWLWRSRLLLCLNLMIQTTWHPWIHTHSSMPLAFQRMLLVWNIFPFMLDIWRCLSFRIVQGSHPWRQTTDLHLYSQLDWSLTDTHYCFSCPNQTVCTLLNMENLFVSVLLARNQMKVKLYWWGFF